MTSAYPTYMHPWFRMPSLKRKSSFAEDLSSREATSQSYLASRPKRRRCENLEHGIAQLSLNAAVDASMAGWVPVASLSTPLPPGPSPPFTAPPLSPQPPQTRAPWDAAPPMHAALDARSSPAAAPEVADVDVPMKGPSWYEVEKDRTSPSAALALSPAHVRTERGRAGIVVTDLDDSDSDEPAPAPSGAPGSMVVSPAVLDRLARLPRGLPASPASDPGASKALVLFRPLINTRESGADEERARKDVVAEVEENADDLAMCETPPALQDDDAMDIEI
ncbi:hypothetical protein B0H21DRAFT_881798 [Amylocystis lapponica]|nr:hypothetical protein B0H21DRAFT_881798 [Amylocystis lapponica]